MRELPVGLSGSVVEAKLLITALWGTIDFLSQSEWEDWIHSAEGGLVQLQQQQDGGW